jgi:glycerol-3-phosphate dehydrogenase subunit B
VPARAVTVDLDVGGPTANAVGLARQFDDRSFRIEAARRIGAAAGLREGERVGLPAVLGTRDASAAWREISERLERSVFEIPTLPPSAAGVRVYDALSRALRSAGGRIVLGAEVIDCTREGERVAAVLTRASGHHVAYRAGWVVLATGGFGSGAIELGSDWEVRERVLGLPLAGVPAAGAPRFTGSYFDSHPLSRVGVAVDSSLIASGTSNVLVAGAALPGAEPWREKSGEGIAVATGCFVADVVAHGVAEVAR